MPGDGSCASSICWSDARTRCITGSSSERSSHAARTRPRAGTCCARAMAPRDDRRAPVRAPGSASSSRLDEAEMTRRDAVRARGRAGSSAGVPTTRGPARRPLQWPSAHLQTHRGRATTSQVMDPRPSRPDESSPSCPDQHTVAAIPELEAHHDRIDRHHPERRSGRRSRRASRRPTPRGLQRATTPTTADDPPGDLGNGRRARRPAVRCHRPRRNQHHDRRGARALSRALVPPPRAPWRRITTRLATSGRWSRQTAWLRSPASTSCRSWTAGCGA